MIKSVSCRIALLFIFAVGAVDIAAADPAPRSLESRAPIDSPVNNARIEIDKSDRELLLYSGDEMLRRFPVGLGFNPVDDKVREGDGATPEGEFIVVVKNPQSQFYLSLGINYPNREDAERGLADGLISAEEHRRIVAADSKGTRPPWNTALGGEIFIHGRGSSSDWTLGCVALDDSNMKELFAAVAPGTPVIIRP